MFILVLCETVYDDRGEWLRGEVIKVHRFTDLLRQHLTCFDPQIFVYLRVRGTSSRSPESHSRFGFNPMIKNEQGILIGCFVTTAMCSCTPVMFPASGPPFDPHKNTSLGVQAAEHLSEPYIVEPLTLSPKFEALT